MNITMFLFHPRYSESRANRHIVEGIKKEKSDITIHHIDSLYTSDTISVEKEQALLISTDYIIFQFPYYWYTIPGMMKCWLDSVFTYNFAFGSEGNKLKDKSYLVSVTVGGKQDTYSPEGYNSSSVEEYLLFFEQIGRLTQMQYKGIVASYGYGMQADLEYVEKSTKEHRERLLSKLSA